MPDSVTDAPVAAQVAHRDGLRERKKDATRRALARRAFELAVELGYDGFTIADLTEQVGVSRRTFSNYFASKAACLVAVGEEWTEDLLADLQHPPPETTLAEQLQAALTTVAQNTADWWEQIAVIADSEPEVQAHLANVDADTIRQASVAVSHRLGVPVDDLRVELLVTFSVAACRAGTARWISGGRIDGSAGLIAILERCFTIIDIDAVAAMTPADPT